MEERVSSSDMGCRCAQLEVISARRRRQNGQRDGRQKPCPFHSNSELFIHTDKKYETKLVLVSSDKRPSLSRRAETLIMLEILCGGPWIISGKSKQAHTFSPPLNFLCCHSQEKKQYLCWIAALQTKRVGPFLITGSDGIWKLGGAPQRSFLLVHTQSDPRASAGHLWPRAFPH